MAQQDNTLGAPTEGLGQTVTFANSAGSRTPQTPSRQRGAMRNSSRGGEARLTSQALQIPDQGGDATLKAFAKLGEQIVRPIIERERTAAYFSGMQRAAAREAIAEIVDEQPWFSKLFGSTSLIDGARAYTANAKAASVAADMEAKMPELRKLSANEFGEYATKAITSQTTGDPTTDMMLSQQISALLPYVMKGQAKAHLRYKQEQVETSIQSSQEATFALLGTVDAESRQPGATRDSSDLLGVAIDALEVFKKPAEMQQELHDKLLGESAIKAISGGNFAVYNLLKDSGKLAQLEPQVAYNVSRAYQQASTQAKLNVSDQFLQKVADFRTMARQPGMTDKAILAVAKAIDDEYEQTKGDKGGFIGKASTLAEMQQLREYRDAQARADRRAVEAARTKAEKDSAELTQKFNSVSRIIGGDGKDPYLMLTETPKERQDNFDLIRATASPAVRLRVLVDQYRVATDHVEKNQNESAIAQALRAGDPALLHKFYQERYLPLLKAGGDLGAAIAEEYSGAYGDKMAKYHSIANGAVLPADMQGDIYNEVVLAPKPLVGNKHNDEIVKELTTNRFMAMFTTPIKDPAGYAALLAPKIKSWLGVSGVSGAVEDARKNSPDVSLLAGYHWSRGSGKSDVAQWLTTNFVEGGSTSKTLEADFATTVEKQIKLAGIEGAAKVDQLPDTPDKQPQLYVKGLGSDGVIKLKVFTASDIHADRKAGLNRFTKDDLQFGPKLTNVPADDQPSIYAPDAEREAYRKKQAAKPK